MKDQIKHLAEQAGIEYVEQMQGWVAVDKDIEKFVELIIEECAQFCEDKNSKLLGTMLKEHFGVE